MERVGGIVLGARGVDRDLPRGVSLRGLHGRFSGDPYAGDRGSLSGPHGANHAATAGRGELAGKPT